MGFSIPRAGAAVAAYGAGEVLAGGIGGYLADWLGRRPTIALSTYSSAAAMVVLSQMHVYGAILALAVSSGTVLQAGVLLLAYAAGLSVPFLALGVAYSSVKPFYIRVKRYTGAVNYASGVLLIIVGILIFTDSLINLNNLFNFGLLGDVSGGA